MGNENNNFVVKYKKEGTEFQVLVDYEKLLEFRDKKIGDVYEVLFDDKIYADSKKGQVQSEKLIENIFDNKSEEEVLKEILEKGNCQVPTSYLNKKRDLIKEKVVEYISSSTINPQTKSKFTSSMISSEIEKIKYNYNPNMDHIHQAEEVIKLLNKNFPIKVDIKTLDILIPATYASSLSHKIRKYGLIKKEFYDNHGALKIHIEVNTNNYDNLIWFLKNETKNTCEYHNMD